MEKCIKKTVKSTRIRQLKDDIHITDDCAQDVK